MRALPKRIRRELVPVPGSVERFLATNLDQSRSLQDSITDFIRRECSLLVTQELWPTVLPPYLLMRFRVVDANGETLAAARDPEELPPLLATSEPSEAAHRGQADAPATGRRTRSRRGGRPPRGAAGTTPPPAVERAAWQVDNMTTWSCDTLPLRVNVGSAAVPIYHYPALVDHAQSAAVELFPNAEYARRKHREGLLRLYLMALEKPLRALGSLKGVSGQAATILAIIGGHPRQIAQEIAACAVAAHTLDGRALPRDDAAFSAPLADATASLYATARELTVAVEAALQAGSGSLLAVEQLRTPLNAPACDDIAQHIRQLLGEGFVSRCPATSLQRLPIYVQGIAMRLERLKHGVTKDLQRLEMLAPYRDRWLAICDDVPESMDAQAVADYRWLLEEWRISLFAQELGTAVNVSAKRLDKAWALVSLKE